MSTHRIGLLLTLVATSALAAKPVSPPSLAAVGNWYADVGVGYALHQWRDTIGNLGESETWDRGNGGLAGGFDIGYQFSQPFSLEAGFYQLPKATLTSGGSDYQFRSNMAYLALRGDWPVLPSLNVFSEVGVDINNASGGQLTTSSLLTFKTRDHMGPMFALGGTYSMTQHVSLGLKYLYADGENTNINEAGGSPTQVNPKAQLLLATLGYHFADLGSAADRVGRAAAIHKKLSAHIGLGVASHQWQDEMGQFGDGETWRNGDGGFVLGGDLGYRFSRHFGVEAGFYQLTKSTININGGSYDLKSNLTYLALRGDWPLTKAFSLFTEAGAAVQNAKGDQFFSARYYDARSHVGPMFAVGGEYAVSDAFLLGVKYLYADGESMNDSASLSYTRIAPKAQLVLATVGYRI